MLICLVVTDDRFVNNRAPYVMDTPPRTPDACRWDWDCQTGTPPPAEIGSPMPSPDPGIDQVHPSPHTLVCDTVVCMTQVDRLSVTMAPDIGTAVREAAAREGTSVSAWLADAAAQRLRNDLLGVALNLWETEDGPFSDHELNTAAAALNATRRRGAA